MFGCLVAGRLVQTEIQRIDKTHFVFNIENADTVNHVVVFLTGTMPFPEGMGGAIHFSWPSPEGVSWQFLGYITNDKPSAIFKVSGLKKGHSGRGIQCRLSSLPAQRIDKTHFVFNIENADTVNHVVVFLTGTMPFPEGMGGAIHFSWPSPEGVSWQFLGYITNDKPSAIFKVSGLKKGTISSNNPFMQAGQQSSTVTQIGIAVEPTSQIAQRIPVENAQTSNLSNFTQFTTKMLENLFNYASSFAITQAQMTRQPDVSWVPLNVLNQWYENFKKRMLQDPNFWKK